MKRPLAWVLTILFIVALLMGPGPGMLIANRPVAVFGLPALYVWALLWYGVEVAVVVAAFIWVWRDDEPGDSAGSSDTSGGGTSS